MKEDLHLVVDKEKLSLLNYYFLMFALMPIKKIKKIAYKCN